MDTLARALGAGLLLALSFPPVGGWPLAWLAPGLLYTALCPHPRRAGGQHGLGSGFVFGAALFLVGGFWMTALAWPLWLALLVFPGGLYALYGALNGALLPRLPLWARPLAFAGGWTFFEWLRGLGLYATPWFTLASAHAAPSALRLLQCVSLIRSEGLAFCLVLTSALLAEGLRQRRAFFLTALLIPAALLLVPMPAPTGLPVRLALLQAGRADAPAEAIYLALTRQAARSHPACIVWPEGTATELKRERIAALAQEVHTPVLVGIYEMSADLRPHNLALLFDTDGRAVDGYAKQRLAPFGEVYPFQDWVPGLYGGFGIHHRSYIPGERAGKITLPTGQTMGVGICFESAFGWGARQSAAQGSELLVYLTSGQVFGQSAELAQHRDHAVVRAVENRISVLQAATTGMTFWIDPAGRVRQQLPPHRSGILLTP